MTLNSLCNYFLRDISVPFRVSHGKKIVHWTYICINLLVFLIFVEWTSRNVIQIQACASFKAGNFLPILCPFKIKVKQRNSCLMCLSIEFYLLYTLLILWNGIFILWQFHTKATLRMFEKAMFLLWKLNKTNSFGNVKWFTVSSLIFNLCLWSVITQGKVCISQMWHFMGLSKKIFTHLCNYPKQNQFLGLPLMFPPQ